MLPACVSLLPCWRRSGWSSCGCCCQVGLVAALLNPDNPNAENHIRDLQAAAGTFGLQLLVLKLREGADFETAFATLHGRRWYFVSANGERAETRFLVEGFFRTRTETGV